jgi:hypothetical protein
VRPAALVLVAAAALAALVSAFALFALHTDSGLPDEVASAWTETAWPFGTDPFGRGKAYRCGRAHCGAEIRLYVRAKLGFCNCMIGVADDDDLDRMGDLYLVAEKATPLLPSRPIAIGPMRGRSRVYELGPNNPLGKTAISVGVSDRCDMIVATVVLPQDAAAEFERRAMAFLSSPTMLRWAEVTLGL